MKVFYKIAMATAVTCSSQVNADMLGFAHGRSADVSDYSDMSVDAGLQVGDTEIWGARLTGKVSDTVALYGDFGFASLDKDDFETNDGESIGGGFILEIEDLSTEFNTALTANYHLADFDNDFESSVFEIRGLMSDNIRSQGTPLSWYASIGLAFINYEYESCRGAFGRDLCVSEDDDDTELALGGGLIAKIGAGEGYVGAEYVDGFSLATGYRFNF